MKKFFEYLKNRNVTITIFVMTLCAIIYVFREKVELQPHTITFINLSAIGVLVVMLYTAVRKHSIRWRYIVCVLLMMFVFNRFYDEVAFEETFHFERTYFWGLVGIGSAIVILSPVMKRFIQWITKTLEEWVGRRVDLEQQGKSPRKRRRLYRKEIPIVNVGSGEDMGSKISQIENEERKKEIRENESSEKGKKVNPLLFGVVLFTLVTVSGVLLFIVSSAQISTVMERMTSESLLSVILSFAVSFLLLVFLVGIIVSLLVKWVRIIMDIIHDQKKGETYFVVAICLFIISQYIFSVYPYSTDDVADLLINGKLFTFPLILCILIPIFLIFAESIISHFKENDKIHGKLEECKDKMIDIAVGIVLALLNFIAFVTSDYLTDIIELTKEGGFCGEESKKE